MSTAPEITKAEATAAVPALVVFGRDEAGKAHAAYFDQSEAALAEKAADFMSLRVLRVRTDEHRALAAQLPHGRVFASGRAFVPFVKAALFLQLQTAAQAAIVGPLYPQRVQASGRIGSTYSKATPPQGTRSLPSC